MTRRDRQRGFTLIELMVALVVSSLLVGMILAIFSRMSSAYRGQQQIAGVQQVLSAARATIEFDAKQAGLGMAQGFWYAGDGKLHQAVKVVNSNSGPDAVAFFYGDTSTQAAVTNVAAWPTGLTVDSTLGFAIDDRIVVSVADITTMSGLTATEANITKYSACVLQIQQVTSATTLTFRQTAPWGKPGNTHCTAVPATAGTTMVYKFVSRAYRIDTSTAARAAVGPFQMTDTGGLLAQAPGFADSWAELAYGFTDLQTSLQVYDPGLANGDSLDPDSDPDRDWYSSATQDALTADSNGAPMLAGSDGLLQISISLVARTDRDVEGVSSPTTPPLIDPLNVANNMIGDRAAIALPAQPPWLADPALQGARIYRYTTFQVDFRNLGVGR